MALETAAKIIHFPCNSSRIKLTFLLITLICEACLYTLAETDQVSKRTLNGEVAEEIGNPAGAPEEDTSHFFASLENQDDDISAYKRHLGAIAALSGYRSSGGSKAFIPPSKKHLGSIAAQSVRPAARKYEYLTPSEREMYKRHLGSLMAISKSKLKPLTRSLKEPSDYRMDSLTDKGELETPTMNHVMNSHPWLNYGNTFDPDIISREEIQLAPELFLDVYSHQPNLQNENLHFPSQLEYANDVSDNKLPSMHLPQLDESLNEELLDNDVEGTIGDDAPIKSKRFLGPLARGGWFPRHFRGIISENSFGKRHIGSLARLGWMPHAKGAGTGRLNDLEEQRGEIGLKRNNAYPRRRMLYHFTAPSLWTSPRGK
ncbi:unnamed protein product [Orchesella dallaii]|uniref:Uncharacterized protein n=1 Tax=Orchesella dallaii TaxID=48710 RepID=A0ABP1QVX9_9HEXA